MDFISHLSRRSLFRLILMPTEQGTLLTIVPLQGIIFFLVTPLSLGAARNNLLLLVLVQRQNIEHLLTPLLSSFGYVGFSRTQALIVLLQFRSIVTIEMPSKLPTMTSSISVPSILRSTVTLFVITYYRVLYSSVQYLLRTSQLTYSPNLCLQAVSVILSQNSSWCLFTQHEFEGGCQNISPMGLRPNTLSCIALLLLVHYSHFCLYKRLSLVLYYSYNTIHRLSVFNRENNEFNLEKLNDHIKLMKLLFIFVKCNSKHVIMVPGTPSN